LFFALGVVGFAHAAEENIDVFVVEEAHAIPSVRGQVFPHRAESEEVAGTPLKIPISKLHAHL